MGKIVIIVSLVIVIAAVLFCTIGYGSPWWIDSTGVSTGLFQYCVKVDGSWKCEKFDSKLWTDEQKATMAMMTIGVLAGVAALVLFSMTLCGMMTIKAGAGVSIGAGMLVLIGIMIYGTQDGLKADVLGWSFWLATIGGIGHLANGIITFILDCLSCCDG